MRTRHLGSKSNTSNSTRVANPPSALSKLQEAEALELMPLEMRDELLLEDYATLPHLRCVLCFLLKHYFYLRVYEALDLCCRSLLPLTRYL